MERDTIAQRISALRKEVFLVPPSPVSDPSRAGQLRIAGVSAVVQQQPVIGLSLPSSRRSPRASFPVDTPADVHFPKRLHSLSPRLTSSVHPAGSSPTSQEADGGNVASRSSSRRSSSGAWSPSSGETSDPQHDGHNSSYDAKANAVRGPTKLPRRSGPVRADVRVSVPKSVKTAGLRPVIGPAGGQHMTTLCSRAMDVLPRRAPQVSAPAAVISTNIVIESVEHIAGDVGGSPTDPLPTLPVSSTIGPDASTVVLPAVGRAPDSVVAQSDTIPVRTVSAVPPSVVAVVAEETRSQSAPSAHGVPPSDLNGPRQSDPMSPRAVARLKVSTTATLAVAVPASEDSAVILPAPASTRRRAGLALAIPAAGAPPSHLPLTTPIVSSNVHQPLAPQPPPSTTNKPSGADVLFTLSPRRIVTSVPIRTPTVATVSKDAECIVREASVASAMPVPPSDRRPNTSLGFVSSSPRAATGGRRLTPKGSPSPRNDEHSGDVDVSIPAVVSVVPSVPTEQPQPGTETKVPLIAPLIASSPAVAPPSSRKPLTVKRGTFSFDDDDIEASDAAHGFMAAPVTAVTAQTPTVCVATPPDASGTPISSCSSLVTTGSDAVVTTSTPPISILTPGSAKRKVSVPSLRTSLATDATVLVAPPPPKGTPKLTPKLVVPSVSVSSPPPAEVPVPPPAPAFTPFPAGFSFQDFDVDVDLSATLPVVPSRARPRSLSPPLEVPHRPSSGRKLSPDADASYSGGYRSRSRRRSSRNKVRLPDHLKAFEPVKVNPVMLEGMMRQGRESWRDYRETVKSVRGECEFMGTIHEDKGRGYDGSSHNRRGSLPANVRSRLGAIAGGIAPLSNILDEMTVDVERLPVDDWFRVTERGWQSSPQSTYLSTTACLSEQPKAGLRSKVVSLRVDSSSNTRPGPVMLPLASPLAVALPPSAPGRRRVGGMAVRVEVAGEPSPSSFGLLTSPVAASKYTPASRSLSSSSSGGVLGLASSGDANTCSTSTLKSLKDSVASGKSQRSHGSRSDSRKSDGERRRPRSSSDRHRRRRSRRHSSSKHSNSSSRHRRTHRKRRSPSLTSYSSDESYSSDSDGSSSVHSVHSAGSNFMSSESESESGLSWESDADSVSSSDSEERLRHRRHRRRHSTGKSSSRHHRSRHARY